MNSLAAVAAWATLYSSSNDVAYLHLRNNAVLQIFADDAGAPNRLPDPPNNATLVITLDNRLLAFYGTSFCETLKVVQYNSTNKAWNPITVTGFAPNYLSQSIYMASPSSDLVFIYGGRNLSSACHTSYIQDPSTIYDSRISYVVSNEIKAFNITNNSYKSIKTASSPTAMFAAGVMRMPFASSSLLVGGKAQNGWIGMNQLALWEYSSWTFISTANSARVDSRTNPLVLPLNSPAGQLTSKATNSSLVLGGKVNSHVSLPYFVGLDLDPVSGWSWNANLNQTLIASTEKILGAVTFENTLITIMDKSSETEDTTDVIERRNVDLNYQINYFNMTSWTEAKGFTPSASSTDTTASVSSSTAEPSKTEESSPKATKKIALSTVLPVSFFFVGAALTGVFLYRRKKRKEEDLIPVPRPLSLSPYLGGASSLEQQMLNSHSSGPDRDTASFQSWTEKRRIYEEQEHFQQQYAHHYQQPYMPINSQNGNTSADLGVVSIGEGNSDYDSPFENVIHHDDCIPLQPLPSLDYQPQPRRANTIRQASETIVNYFKGKRSASSATAPASYQRSTSAASYAQDISDMQIPHSSLGRHEAVTTKEEDDEFFEGRDVQILVSSKRRTRLRVVNPDPDTPSRNNSDHSTIASLNVKKQRAGRYAPLTNQPETGVMLRRSSSTSITPSVQIQLPGHQDLDISEIPEEAEQERDLSEARIGTRAVSSGSAYAWRKEHE
ncbi:hypothetical protein D0Z00_000066 [Geotrichum galactomycetum]|uniref:Uncharacterized protein n=1 Tax=Geotrichum galactomycetum TaxID=27317 RepID=A0ACB6VAT3_9ASCO|nr:hypothetical protein D0Z00_000066 [Geotrichum candidum]